MMTNKMTMMIDDYSAPHVPRYASSSHWAPAPASNQGGFLTQVSFFLAFVMVMVNKMALVMMCGAVVIMAVVAFVLHHFHIELKLMMNECDCHLPILG